MSEYSCVSVEKAKQLIASGPINIIDTRDEQSYREQHIEGAVSLQMLGVGAVLNELDPDVNTLCYCYHGISSQPVAQFFAAQGFDCVFSMDGGFEAWRASLNVE